MLHVKITDVDDLASHEHQQPGKWPGMVSPEVKHA